MDYLAQNTPFYIWGILVFLTGVYFTYTAFKVEYYNKAIILSIAIPSLAFSLTIIGYDSGLLSPEASKKSCIALFYVCLISLLISHILKFFVSNTPEE
ncbi:hypothetical protein [Pseudalkalibacillus hwajinpoensis]|uniref:Uncharacterized protein n=1 Tax=Guptibacillus hwajinpoensis TaxID=208199 RepID=A0A4U1MGF7_9BACL|nr:hypothetical protein [Pseudalkalibacillus hwajinpoensis]TKD69390.1 hypothetical protein FBF83_15495 [Pseudalkalibacillus hwajinpoensis]